MENIDLGTMIVGAICSIGMIQIITWIVVLIKHPGYDYIRPELGHAAYLNAGLGDNPKETIPQRW